MVAQVAASGSRPRAKGASFPRGPANIPKSNLTDMVLVTRASFNQSLRLRRDCADEPDLGHVAPEPGLREGERTVSSRSGKHPPSWTLGVPLLREMGLLPCQSYCEV